MVGTGSSLPIPFLLTKLQKSEKEVNYFDLNKMKRLGFREFMSYLAIRKLKSISFWKGAALFANKLIEKVANKGICLEGLFNCLDYEHE